VDDDGKPLFPFGYGLSYTTFAYSHLTAQPPPHLQGDVDIAVDVTNTGERFGEEVAQLYIRQDTSSVETPERSLKGFQRLPLQPHETKTVHFRVPLHELELWNAQGQWNIEPGQYTVWAGGSSQAELKASFSLQR
jgi:beta-glucosidase